MILKKLAFQKARQTGSHLIFKHETTKKIIPVPIHVGITENEAKELALKSEKIKKWTEGKKIFKSFYIQDKLLNLLTK